MHTPEIERKSHLENDRTENEHPVNDRKTTQWIMTKKHAWKMYDLENA